MPWKLARAAVALALCVAFLAGARADEDDKPKEKPKQKMPDLPPHFKKCFNAVLACGNACAEAFKLASDKLTDGEKKYQAPRLWTIDCGQTCQLTALILARQGPGHKITCEACARMCDECAKACKGFDDDEMKSCVKQCQACAKACREMVKHKDDKKDTKKDKEKEKGKEKKGEGDG